MRVFSIRKKKISKQYKTQHCLGNYKQNAMLWDRETILHLIRGHVKDNKCFLNTSIPLRLFHVLP